MRKEGERVLVSGVKEKLSRISSQDAPAQRAGKGGERGLSMEKGRCKGGKKDYNLED